MRAMPESTISNKNQDQIIFLFCNNKKGACFYLILFTPHIVRLPTLLTIYQEIDSEKRGQSDYSQICGQSGCSICGRTPIDLHTYTVLKWHVKNTLL